MTVHVLWQRRVRTVKTPSVVVGLSIAALIIFAAAPAFSATPAASSAAAVAATPAANANAGNAAQPTASDSQQSEKPTEQKAEGSSQTATSGSEQGTKTEEQKAGTAESTNSTSSEQNNETATDESNGNNSSQGVLPLPLDAMAFGRGYLFQGPARFRPMPVRPMGVPFGTPYYGAGPIGIGSQNFGVPFPSVPFGVGGRFGVGPIGIGSQNFGVPLPSVPFGVGRNRFWGNPYPGMPFGVPYYGAGPIGHSYDPWNW
jgi:hypothetical protein